MGASPDSFVLLYALVQVLGFVIVILIFFWTENYRNGFDWGNNAKQEFNWHPLNMTSGMVITLGNGILLFRVLRKVKKKILKILHACTNLSSLIMAILGLKAVFNTHYRSVKVKQHMYSYHSWLGMIVLVLFSCQLVLGFLMFVYPKAPPKMRTGYLAFHAYFGVIMFISAATISMIGLVQIALFSDSYARSDKRTEAFLINFLALSIFVFSNLVVYLVIGPKFKRHYQMEVEEQAERPPQDDKAKEGASTPRMQSYDRSQGSIKSSRFASRDSGQPAQVEPSPPERPPYRPLWGSIFFAPPPPPRNNETK